MHDWFATCNATFLSSASVRVQTVIGALIAGRFDGIVVAVVVVIGFAFRWRENELEWCVVWQ